MQSIDEVHFEGYFYGKYGFPLTQKQEEFFEKLEEDRTAGNKILAILIKDRKRRQGYSNFFDAYFAWLFQYKTLTVIDRYRTEDTDSGYYEEIIEVA